MLIKLPERFLALYHNFVNEVQLCRRITNKPQIQQYNVIVLRDDVGCEYYSSTCKYVWGTSPNIGSEIFSSIRRQSELDSADVSPSKYKKW